MGHGAIYRLRSIINQVKPEDKEEIDMELHMIFTSLIRLEGNVTAMCHNLDKMGHRLGEGWDGSCA